MCQGIYRHLAPVGPGRDKLVLRPKKAIARNIRMQVASNTRKELCSLWEIIYVVWRKVYPLVGYIKPPCLEKYTPCGEKYTLCGKTIPSVVESIAYGRPSSQFG